MTPANRSHDRRRDAEPELTPAASELLDEYVAQIRRRVLDESVRLQPGDVALVRMNTMREILEELEETRSGHQPFSKLRRMRTIPATITLVIVFTVGLVLLFTVTVSDRIQGPPSFAIGLTSGLVAALGSAGAVYLYRKQAGRNRTLSAHVTQTFLEAISELEVTARKVGSHLLSSDPETASLGRVMTALERSGIWRQEHIRDFRKLVGIRNALVHESATSLSNTTLLDASTLARRLLENLQDREQEIPVVSAQLFENAIDYEYSVGAALRRVVGENSVARIYDSDIDYLVEMPMGTTAVEAKFTDRKELELQQVHEIIDRTKTRSGHGLLIVTNANLSAEVREFNASSASQPRPVEVVSWNADANDGLLLRALARLARQPETTFPTSGLRFQMYTDSHGGYRFRLLAPNGSVIAVSEAYSTRRELTKQIENLRHAANTSQLEDKTGV